MDKRLFVLRSDEIKREMVIFVANLPMEPLMQVEIKPFDKSRSLAQNRTYHGVWLKAIREKAIESGFSEFSSEEWHEFFRKRYVPVKVVQMFGEIVEVRKSTKKLTVKEFIKYGEDINLWVYENMDGFQLPDLITKDYE